MDSYKLRKAKVLSDLFSNLFLITIGEMFSHKVGENN